MKASGKRQWHKRAVNIYYTQLWDQPLSACSCRPNTAWSLCINANVASGLLPPQRYGTSKCGKEKKQQKKEFIRNCWSQFQIKKKTQTTWVLFYSSAAVQALSIQASTLICSPNSLPPFVFLPSAIALWNWIPVQTEGHNCWGWQGAWRHKSASSHGDSCENKTQAIKC